jgi:hypothetical protein
MSTSLFFHVGTFEKDLPVDDCLHLAKSAFQNQHFQLLFEDAFIVIARGLHSNETVEAEVACAPLQERSTHVAVSAFSSDSITAEFVRNTVRTFIVDHTPF